MVQSSNLFRKRLSQRQTNLRFENNSPRTQIHSQKTLGWIGNAFNTLLITLSHLLAYIRIRTCILSLLCHKCLKYGQNMITSEAEAVKCQFVQAEDYMKNKFQDIASADTSLQIIIHELIRRKRQQIGLNVQRKKSLNFKLTAKMDASNLQQIAQVLADQNKYRQALASQEQKTIVANQLQLQTTGNSSCQTNNHAQIQTSIFKNRCSCQNDRQSYSKNKMAHLQIIHMTSFFKHQQQPSITAQIYSGYKMAADAMEGCISQNQFYYNRSELQLDYYDDQVWNQTTSHQEQIPRKKYVIHDQPTNNKSEKQSCLKQQKQFEAQFLKYVDQYEYQVQIKQTQISQKKEQPKGNNQQNSYEASSIIQKYQFPRIDYQRCVGMTQSIWFTKFGKIQAVGYATAFAISSRIIVTCAHACIAKNMRPCDKIYFIPFHPTTHQPRTTLHDIFQSADQDFLRYEPLNSNQRYGKKPLEKDYAVFILKKPFQNNCYLQLDDQKPLSKHQNLNIWGYPSKQYNLNTRLVDNYFPRVDLEGQFEKRNNHILIHNMPTLGGHSGSPIVRLQDSNGKQSIKVVGIHTHKGKDNLNEGLAMTSTLKSKIMKYSQQLCQIHKENVNAKLQADQPRYNLKVDVKPKLQAEAYKTKTSKIYRENIVRPKVQYIQTCSQDCGMI